jgi:hypothetical protein
LIYAENISKALVFYGPIVDSIDQKQLQRQGINQQEINELKIEYQDKKNIYNSSFLS